MRNIPRSTEPLLNSIEREKLPGIKLNSACRAGECALCRTKLISGEYFMPSNVNLREGDRQFGYLHPCVVYPLTDIEIELYNKRI